MCSSLGPMAQKIPMQEQISPQMDPKPEMGAAAAEAAVYDTSPPLPHQNPPPIPAETVHLSAPDIAQLFAMLAGMNEKMNGNAQQLENKMDGNTDKMENGAYGPPVPCENDGKSATISPVHWSCSFHVR